MPKPHITTDGRVLDIDRRIGENCRAVRKRLGYTLSRVADLLSAELGVAYSQQAVSAWECGTRRMWAAQVAALAKIYQCPVDMLLYGSAVQTEPVQVSKRMMQTLRFSLYEWDGDRTALQEFCRLYMALPPKARAEIAFAGLHEFDQARERGEIVTDIDVDEDLIEQAWRTVLHKANAKK